MLLKFQVENFRSIRDEATIDLVADSRQQSKGVLPGFYSEQGAFRVLPAIGLFGQNASGKSNVLRALFDYSLLCVYGNLETQPTDISLSHVTPFLFDAESREKPTKFSATFLLGGTLFEYSFAFKDRAFTHEEVKLGPIGGQALPLLFSRELRAGKMLAKFGDGMSAGHRAIVTDMGHSKLCLGVLWDMTDSPLTQLKALFLSGFAMPFTPKTQRVFETHILNRLKSDPSFAERVRSLLCAIDIKFASFKFGDSRFQFVHRDASDTDVLLDSHDESEGTQQLTFLGAHILGALESGTLLVIDELDSHLHPLITRQLISLFQNPKVNRRNSQLIFSSHDATLLDQSLMRRDQFYLANRDAAGATSLECVSDYGIRNDLVLEKAYFEGRLSGLPVLKYTDEFHDLVTDLLKPVLK